MRPDVTAVVLRYNGAAAALDACVASILAGAPDGGRLGVEVVLVDNASDQDPGACRRTAEAHGPRVQVLTLDRNHGFAGGVNRGIQASSGELVLLLNDDAVLCPGALDAAVDALRGAPQEVVAVAFKMVLASDPFLLDGVGIAINGRGEAFNRGLGQPDIGQYDVPEDCLGPCFGAALVRRAAFDRFTVGPLEESYFLYYEDVEWSWRASLSGYRTITAPAAVASHDMSASSRAASPTGYAFKHRFIERNLLASVARCFEPRRAAGIWARRWPALVKGRITGEFPKASFGAAQDALLRLPGTLMARRRIQAGRRLSDSAVIAFSQGESTFFDAVRYRPVRPFEALAAAADRRARVRPGEDAGRWSELAERCRSAAPGAPVDPELRELASGLDSRLGPYLDAAACA